MRNEKQKIIRTLKQYHDSKFTPRVYEHSIFGKAALLLEGTDGRWEEWWPGISLIMTGEEMLYRCSACDAKYPDVENYNFCPRCGAKMNGVKNNALD